jgi:hypothetical protein
LRHEKPLPVQDKIGDWTARPIVSGMSHPPVAARLRRAEAGGRARKGAREMTAEAPQGAEQNPAYRPQS